MHLDIPYLSQFSDVERLAWRPRACAITCLAMVLRFLHPQDAPSIDGLVGEGLTIGGMDAHGNRTHTGIVRLARNHGLHAYSQEFRSVAHGAPSPHEPRMIKEGLAKMCRSLAAGMPVLASVHRRDTGSPHMVVLVGYEQHEERCGEFTLHDPGVARKEDGAHIVMSHHEFRAHWRNMAIFFEHG